jgi:hypothetical protein
MPEFFRFKNHNNIEMFSLSIIFIQPFLGHDSSYFTSENTDHDTSSYVDEHMLCLLLLQMSQYIIKVDEI